jgi:predicted GIY-YIG superfamily endonuclease
MTYYVYVLACFIDGDFSCYYVGQTNDLDARMEEHYEAVRSHDTDKYTGRFDFVKLVWHRRVPTREDALRLESYLKSLSPSGKERYMDNN